MLILPLHRRLSWANFPLVTVLLIIANVFVFAFLQSGDERDYRRALEYYEQVDLGRIEFPAYLDWLKSRRGDARKIELAETMPKESRIGLIESDPDFLKALHAGRVIQADDARYATWHEERAEFERLRDSAFTPSHDLRFSHVEPGRMLWAMFMHGGLEHLIGNMIFLAVLGLLVEGALGPWWYLALYLGGGFGAAFATLAWHWGDEGTALGASGAIAALMGAYCVLWGLRKVRVFYWFFVVFDYVRVPALTLLPIWFGWQVVNLWLNSEAHVGFDAHAGGILCGALIAFALRRYGAVRDVFVEEDQRADEREANVAAFEAAQQHLGKLEVAKARDLLERIDATEPGRLDVSVALYRCARYRGTPGELDAAAARVLGFAAKTLDDTRELKSVYEDYAKACAGAPRLAPEAQLKLVAPWLKLGDENAAEALLRGIGLRTPQFAGLPAAWFALALRAPEGSAARRARLEYLVAQFAQSEFAPKAKFLLSQ
ncbi:MAG TPA: rhomboid family intramembrane serine protease [Rudaea sp.]|nr:rhomboid family intramembrane serine protease [Rudaea sp.]